MEKKWKMTEDCKVTDLTSFPTLRATEWTDVKIDPPVEVHVKDEISYSINSKTGIVKVYLRRYRSRWWKLIGTNMKASFT